MVFRHLFNYFVNNPQLIEKLSESYPVRRAAQLTVYAYQKGKAIGEGAIQDGLKQGAARMESFTEKFKEELERGMKDITKDNKKRWYLKTSFNF